MPVIWADLGLASTLTRTCQHPGIVWGFRGLHERLNQCGETIEAAHIKLQLDKVAGLAEVPTRVSCYCHRQQATSQ